MIASVADDDVDPSDIAESVDSDMAASDMAASRFSRSNMDNSVAMAMMVSCCLAMVAACWTTPVSFSSVLMVRSLDFSSSS